MTKTKSPYATTFIMGLEHSLEYRFDFFVNILSTLFPIIIQVCLWLAIYGGSGEESMFGYDFAQMMAYVVTAGMVSKFVAAGIEYIINGDIHSGMLASFLIKPVRYVPLRFLQVLGQKFTSTLTLILCTAATVIVLHFAVGFEVVAHAVLLFLPVLLLGMLLNFFIFFLLSTLAFWLTEVGHFFHTIQVVIMVLSGGVFPISVMGETYVAIVRYLPFSYTMYFPITLLTGATPLGEALWGLLLQVIWIGLLWAASLALWRAGLKRYVAVGG